MKFSVLLAKRLIAFLYGVASLNIVSAQNSAELNATIADKRIMVVGCSDYSIKLIDVESKFEIKTLKGHRGPIISLAIDTVHCQLASKSDDKTIRIWDLRKGITKEIFSLDGTIKDNSPVVFSKNGNYFACVNLLMLDVYDAITWNKLETYLTSSHVTSLDFFNHDRYLAAGELYEKRVNIIDFLDKKASIKTVATGPRVYIGNILSTFDEQQNVFVTSFDTTIRLWSGKDFSLLQEVRVPFRVDFLQSLKDEAGFVVGYAPEARAIKYKASRGYDKPLDITEANTGYGGGFIYTTMGTKLVATGLTNYPYSWTGKLTRSDVAQLDHPFLSLDTAQYTALVYYGRFVLPETAKTLPITKSAPKPEIVVQRGHETTVNLVGKSADDNYVFSLDQNGLLKIWDNASQLLLKTLKTTLPTYEKVKCVIQDSMIVIACDNSFESVQVQWWNWVTSEKIKEQQIPGKGSSWWTNDNLLFVLRQKEFGVFETVLYNFVQDTILRTLSPIEEAVLSPKRDRIVGVNLANNEIGVYDFASVRKIKVFTGLLYGKKDIYYDKIKFSIDGNFLGLLDTWGNHFELFNLQAGQSILRLVDKNVVDFSISEKENRLAISCCATTILEDENNRMELRSLGAPAIATSLNPSLNNVAIRFTQYSEDGSLFLAGTNGQLFVQGKYGPYGFTTFNSFVSSPIRTIAYDEKRHTMLLGGYGDLKVLDLRNFSFANTGLPISGYEEYALDQNGQSAAVWSEKTKQIIVSSAEGKKRNIPIEDSIFKVLYWNEGKQLLGYQTLGRQVILRNVQNDQRYTVNLPDSFYVSTLTVSADNRFFAFTSFTKTIYLYTFSDINSPQVITKEPDDVLAEGLGFSNDAKYLVFTGGRKVHFYATRPTSTEYNWAIPIVGVRNIYFTNEGILCAAGDGTLRLYSDDGKILKSVFDVEAPIDAVVSSGEKDLYYALTSEGNLNRIDFSRKRILNTIYLGQNAGLITDQSGYYLTTSRDFRSYGFMYGVKCYSLRQFDLFYNRPDKVLASFDYITPEQNELYKKVVDKRLSSFSRRISSPAEIAELPTLSIKTTVLDTVKGNVQLLVTASSFSSPLKEFRVFVNGVPVVDSSFVFQNNLKNATKNLRISLAPGVNDIQLSVVDVELREALYKAIRMNYASRQKPNLYFLGIGASRYQNFETLDFVDNDIRMVHKSLKTKEGTWFKHLLSDTIMNEKVSRAGIVRAKKLFDGGTANDIAVIFYSGHGVLQNDTTYFLASYDMNFDKPADKGIPYDQLEHLMDAIPQRNKLLLINACHAGEFDPDKEIFKRMKIIFNDFREGNGATIIAASTSDSSALTSSGTGLSNFGAALQMVFAKKPNDANRQADENNDGIVTISELKTFLTETVRQLSYLQQTPTIRRENLDADFRIW